MIKINLLLPLVLLILFYSSSSAQSDLNCPVRQCYKLKAGAYVINNAYHVMKLASAIENNEDEISINLMHDFESTKNAYQTNREFIVYKVDKINASQHLYAYKLKTIGGTPIGWILEDHDLIKIGKRKK